MSDTVLYALDDTIATITLNRPARMNALTPTLFDAWQAALDKADRDGAKAIVLTGAGPTFCAGADLQGGDGPADILGPNLAEPLETHYNALARRLMVLPVPVVSAINGPAVGAGMGFALAADLSVMARSAYLMLAFVKIGLVPDAGSTWLVTRSIGRAKAMELALLGEQVFAEEALSLGLVNRVVEDDAVLEEAVRLARQLAAGPSVAIGHIRRQINSAMDLDFEQTLTLEAGNQAKAGATADFMEALTAFAQKRPPAFKGK